MRRGYISLHQEACHVSQDQAGTADTKPATQG